jgi:hypothetical protein
MYQYRTQQGRRAGLCGCINGLIVLAILVGGVSFVLLRAHNGVTLSVGPHPTIIGDSCGGSVLISAGPANQVTLAGIFPQYNQDSATNTIEITQCDQGLTITVPPQANIQMDASDSITVLGVSGTLNLSTNGSRITLEQVTLDGQSKIDDNGGTIVFNGSLAAGSTPKIDDNGGSIDLTLPAIASFHLTLSGILGPIASNVPGVQDPSDKSGDVQVNVGSNASGTNLTLSLNDTALVLRKV